MLLFRGLLFLVAMGVWIYCVFDVVRSDTAAVHHLHKLVWLVFVVFIPTIGALAWLFLGRPVPLGSRLFQETKPPMRPPDDSPEFLADLGDEIRRRRRAEQMRASESTEDIDEAIRRLEEELRRRAEEEHGDEGPAT